MNPDTASANAKQDSVETMATLSQPKQDDTPQYATFHMGGALAQLVRYVEAKKNETKGSS